MCTKLNYQTPSARIIPMGTEVNFLTTVTGNGLEGWNYDAEEGTWE